MTVVLAAMLACGAGWCGAAAWPTLAFFGPVSVDEPWQWPWLLIPLAVGISLVYKALKLEDLSQLPAQAAMMSLQIIVFMIGAAGLLWLVTEMV